MHTASEQGIDYRKVLDDALDVFFKDALRVSLRSPRQAGFFVRTVRWQRAAARQRARLKQEGVHVPPIMIFSVTNRCNLHCKGCYHQALGRSSHPEMSEERMAEVVEEAKELGISLVVVAGGEPLLREKLIDITRSTPEIIFLVFTNGLLLDDKLLARMDGQRNFVPVISLEGYAAQTDGRRGEGVHGRVLDVVQRLDDKGMFWSVSLTITRSNFETVTDGEFIRQLVDLGCKLFFFLEYTPIEEGTEDWVLTESQRDELMRIRESLRSEFNALFIAVPGDEEDVGGCLSAGRGFVHVSAEGDVEPCPFAPYSDANLRDSSLKDALQSDFLRSIRENRESLSETEGGCALWVEREWVRSLLDSRSESSPVA